MPHLNAPEEKRVCDHGLRSRWTWVVGLSCALLAVVGFLIHRHWHGPVLQEAATSDESVAADQPAPTSAGDSPHQHATREHRAGAPKFTAEEIVAGKVAHFIRKRRELVYAIAQRSQKQIPPEVEKFFEAVESGSWENITNQWYTLTAQTA